MGSIGLGLLGRRSLRLPCEQNRVTPQQLLRQANHRSHCSCLHPHVAPSKARAGRVPPCKAGEESAAWVETVPQETAASSDVSQQTPSIIDAMQDVVNLFVTRQLESIVSYLSIEQVVRAAVMQQTRARCVYTSAFAIKGFICSSGIDSDLCSFSHLGELRVQGPGAVRLRRAI